MENILQLLRAKRINKKTAMNACILKQVFLLIYLVRIHSEEIGKIFEFVLNRFYKFNLR